MKPIKDTVKIAGGICQCITTYNAADENVAMCAKNVCVALLFTLHQVHVHLSGRSESKVIVARSRCCRGSIQSLLSPGPNYVRSLIDFNKGTSRVQTTIAMVVHCPLVCVRTVIGIHYDVSFIINKTPSTLCDGLIICANVVVFSTRLR